MSKRDEHDSIPGLNPEEVVLWQGRPDPGYLARRVFRAHWVGLYLGFFMLLRGGVALQGGASVMESLISMSWVAPLVIIGWGIPTVMAYAHARTTRYTLTERRWILQFGVALDLIVNLPLVQVRSAAFASDSSGTGDIPITLGGAFRGPNGEVLTAGPSYFHLWPHARPWYLTEPQPMLRGVENVSAVARTFAEALQAIREREDEEARSPSQSITPDKASPILVAASSV